MDPTRAPNPRSDGFGIVHAIVMPRALVVIMAFGLVVMAMTFTLAFVAVAAAIGHNKDTVRLVAKASDVAEKKLQEQARESRADRKQLNIRVERLEGKIRP